MFLCMCVEVIEMLEGVDSPPSPCVCCVPPPPGRKGMRAFGVAVEESKQVGLCRSEIVVREGRVSRKVDEQGKGSW